jgi:serine phosphatase RsbU (regulator of sigma subunit)/HAMP domain-containing protein
VARMAPFMTRRRPGSLSARLASRTLLALTLFVILSSGLALIGVVKLVRDQSQSLLSGYSSMLADDISSRLELVDRVLDTFSVEAPKDLTPSVRRRVAQSALDSLLRTNAENIGRVLLIDRDGTIIAQSPSGSPPWLETGPLATAIKSATRPRYVWSEEGSRHSLWMVHPVGAGNPTGLVLLVTPRTGFVKLLVDSASSAQSHVFSIVVDGQGNAFAVPENTPVPDLKHARFDAADGGKPEKGSVSVSTGAVALTGAYRDVSAMQGLGLRVMTLQPQSEAMRSTTRALIPAALTVLLGALAFSMIAGVFTDRLLGPLREFERRARDVTTGAYVRPLQAERDDEVGRLADAFNIMANRINLLQDIAQLLASSSELDHVLDGILSAMGHLFGTGSVGIFLLEENRERLRLARSSMSVEGVDFAPVPLSGNSIVASAFRGGHPLSFAGETGVADDDPVMTMFGSGTVSSGVAVPLVIGQETIGVIVVADSGSRRFSEAEAEMARTFSAQAAVAVNNAHLFYQEQESRHEAEALREVAELLVSPLDLNEALDQVAQIAGDLLDTKCGGFAFTDREALGLHPAEDRELELGRLAVLKMLVERTGDEATDEPVVINDTTADALTKRLADERGISRMLVVPLLHEQRTSGILLLGCGEEVTGFTDRQIALADTIGKEVSLALENAYLFERERSRASNLERIFRISQAVSSSLQVNTVLNRVLDVVQKIFGADAVSLMRYDSVSRSIETSMARGIQSKEMLFLTAESGHDIPGEVFDSMRPRLYGDLAGEPGRTAELALSQGLRSLMVVPLVARGRSIGLLNVLATEADVFGQEDLDLLMTFAAQAALAVDTAELYGREHRVASVLQASILPERLPYVDGIDAQSVYRPGSGEAEIGGDYYDLFRVPDGRVIVAIGDVCGQGVRAATKTSMIKYLLRGLATAGLDPAVALTELNRMVSDSGESADIVTVWVGRINVEEGLLEYASGGHPPAMLLLAGAEGVEPLEPTGPLLGAVHSAEYGLGAVRMPVGATLLMYTDGVTEARRGRELFGEARLKAALLEAGSVAAITQRVLAQVSVFTGGDLHDDVAVLAVRLTGRPDQATDESPDQAAQGASYGNVSDSPSVGTLE